jgi:LPS-assembly protein
VTEDLAFQYENRYSLKDEADIATYYSLNYRQQCWGMRLEFMDKPNDKSIALIFSLLGIGEIGSFNYSPPSSDTMQSTEN